MTDKEKSTGTRLRKSALPLSLKAARRLTATVATTGFVGAVIVALFQEPVVQFVGKKIDKGRSYIRCSPEPFLSRATELKSHLEEGLSISGKLVSVEIEYRDAVLGAAKCGDLTSQMFHVVAVCEGLFQFSKNVREGRSLATAYQRMHSLPSSRDEIAQIMNDVCNY